MRDASKSLSRLLKIAALLTTTYSTSVLAANCIFYGSSTQTLSFGASLAGKSLTVPADTPNGTVIYEDSIQGSQHDWICSSSSQYGIFLNPILGTVASKATTYPIGKTGLSYRLWVDSLSRYESSLRTIIPAKYTIPSGIYRLEIVKSGELAAKTNIPAGYLGKLMSDEVDLALFNLINPIVLNAASCQTPSVPVAMGDDYRLKDFDLPGATPRVIKFNIALNDCQTGINKVTYSLKATTQVIDAQKGIVALNGTSTAKGIGLQLLNDAGQPLALDTTYPFTAFNTTGKNFTIPLSAAYYRLAEGVTQPGSANTEVTFIVSYL